MEKRKKLFLLIPILLVFMLSFVSIDAWAIGNGGNTVNAENGGTGEEGSTESGQSAAENKMGSPEGEVGNSPVSDTPSSTTSGSDSTANQVQYVPATKPANTAAAAPEIKGENRIDCINIDNANKKAKIYFHLDESDTNVQFWVKSSGKLVKLDSSPEFAESSYKKLEEDTASGVHYYFVIDTKSTLSEQYIMSDLKGQIKKLLGDLGANDCISLYTVSGDGATSLTESAIYNNEDGQNTLSTILDSIEYNAVDTNIYNGLYDACSQIGPNSDINLRDVVVAVSDGISQKNSVETEIEDKKDDPLYYTLRENGMSLYFIKLIESTEFTDGKSDFISGEIDTEEPIEFTPNSIDNLKTLLASDCYVTEVSYEDPKVAWPMFIVSFDSEEAAEMSDSISKYRLVSEYLTAAETTTEETASEGNATEEITTEEATTEATTVEATTEQNDSNTTEDSSEKSGLLKNKWPIFAALLVIIVIVIIVIAKKKNK